MATNEEIYAIFGTSSESDTESDTESDSSTESEGDIEMLDSLKDNKEDECAVNKFEDYKGLTLVGPVEVNSYREYVFKLGATPYKRSLKIRFDKLHNKAKIVYVRCDGNAEETTCKEFQERTFEDIQEEIDRKTLDRYSANNALNTKAKNVKEVVKDTEMEKAQEVSGSFKRDSIEIEYVYLGEARGSKLCTVAVSYLLKVLLMESARVGKYPYKGFVYVESMDPCKAVNCYTHAFQNNGFEPNEEEMANFQNKVTKWLAGTQRRTFRFEFENFFSEAQKGKHDAMKSRLKRRRMQVLEDVVNKVLKF